MTDTKPVEEDHRGCSTARHRHLHDGSRIQYHMAGLGGGCVIVKSERERRVEESGSDEQGSCYEHGTWQRKGEQFAQGQGISERTGGS